MLLSVILAWVAVLLTSRLALKFITGRLAKSDGARKFDRFLHKIHIPASILLLAAALAHGLLAGNRPGTPLAEAQIGTQLLTWNAGTLCFVLFLLLGVSYLLRKKLRKHWMPLHRALTVAAVTALVCHLMATGISLDNLLFDPPAREPAVQAEMAAAPSPSVVPSVAPSASPSPSETAAPTEAPTPAPSLPAEESVQEPVSVFEEPTPVTFSGAVLADGVYTGSGEGFKGTITVEVTVEGGAVTDISVVSYWDTPSYFEWALPILDQIQEEQSLEVDAVTGSTWSSAGLQAAVLDALDDAVVEGELAVSTITPTGGRHGGPRP